MSVRSDDEKSASVHYLLFMRSLCFQNIGRTYRAELHENYFWFNDLSHFCVVSLITCLLLFFTKTVVELFVLIDFVRTFISSQFAFINV